MTPSSKNSRRAVIQLTKVVKTYYLGETRFQALRGVDLTITQGELTALVGPSGSGKSTLMHIMGLLDTPTEGRVVFGSRPVDKLIDDQLARLRNQRIGFVFQQFFLLPYLSALDNVALPLVYAGWPLDKRRAQAKRLLTQVGLADKVANKPAQLSGGQQQRVAIARALVNQPALILADEPTGNLDSVSGRQILDLFLHLHKQGHTIVIVTHDMEVAKIAKRRLYLKDGRIIKED